MRKRPKIIIAFACLLLVGIFLMFRLWFSGPSLICHRQVDSALQQWAIETKTGDWFPNVEGRSSNSLAVLNDYIKDFSDWARDYRYVAGLQSSDPAELILFYVKEPSSQKDHSDRFKFRREKRWVVMNPQSEMGSGDRMGEICEWIPTEEFTNRLEKTLRFLEANARPYWTNAAKEHRDFLGAIVK